MGGGQKFLLNRLQAVGTHDAADTDSGPMVTQPMPDVQASVRTLVWLFLPPPAAAPKWPDWGLNRRPQGCRPAALPLGHCLDCSKGPPYCLGPHLPLTKNPNCVYLSDCLLAGSGTGGLTVNLSSRCTAEGNRITSQRLLDQSQAGVYMGKTPHTPPFWPFWAYSRTLPQGVELLV